MTERPAEGPARAGPKDRSRVAGAGAGAGRTEVVWTVLWLCLGCGSEGAAPGLPQPATAEQVSPAARSRCSEKLASRRDHALLIATGRYDDPGWEDLEYPVEELRSLARELEEIYGFRVETLLDKTKEEVVLKLREYTRKKFSLSDQLLVMLAGHGAFDETTKTGYLALRDTARKDASFGSFLAYPAMLRILAGIPVEHLLLVADSCYSGTLDERIATRGQEEIFRYPSDGAYLCRKLELPTKRWLASVGKELAPDPSRLARGLLEGLRTYGGPTGILTLEKLVADHLHGVARWGELPGNEPGSTFLFIRRNRRPVETPTFHPVPPLPPPAAPLPESLGAADGYCSVGGVGNTAKGLRLFRDAFAELQRIDVDIALVRRAERELEAGSPAAACRLYQGAYYALLDSVSHEV